MPKDLHGTSSHAIHDQGGESWGDLKEIKRVLDEGPFQAIVSF